MSDVFAPVSGAVVDRNGALDDRPELVNAEPYGAGWLIMIEADDVGALARLLDADGHRASLDETG